MIENGLSLDIPKLCALALEQFPHSFDKAATQNAVVEFIFDRLKGYCLDKGYSADEFDAVMTLAPTEPLDFMQRLAAVKAFRQLPEADSLAAANKRIRNILKKSDTTPAEIVGELVEAQELQLLAAARQSAQDILPLLAQHDYQATLNRLAGLRNDVDAFFDNVMVMTDDLALRANRLALLELLSAQFLTCADLAKLQS
jgi:glycyl-tRNA synthetase beta chain